MSKDARTADFLRLYSAAQPRLRAYVLTLVPRADDAEEIQQETAVRAWEVFDAFEPGTNFGAWIRKIAYFVVLNARKRQQRGAVLLSDEFLEVVAAENERLSDTLDEQTVALHACVNDLDPADRDLLAKCYEPDAVIKDVAAEVDRPVGTVYKTLTRIRRWLKVCIERRLAAEDRP